MNPVSRIKRTLRNGSLKFAQLVLHVSPIVWNFFKKKMPTIKKIVGILQQAVDLANKLITIAHFLQGK